MSFTGSRDHLSPDDPLYYAPTRLHRGSDFPSTPATETRSDRWRPFSPASRFDALLEQAVAESLRHPPHSELASEPPAFAFERAQRHGSFSVAARLAAAVGAAAIVALLIVVMVPTSQSSDPQDLAATEYRTILASATAAQGNVSPEESRVLLRKFVQWQQTR